MGLDIRAQSAGVDMTHSKPAFVPHPPTGFLTTIFAHPLHTTFVYIAFYAMSMKMQSNRLWNLYYHHFPFYMLTGPESFLLHLFIISFLTFVAYGLFSVIPSYIPFLISRASYYLTGGDY